ncbi:MAG TPA: alpha/beta fold hydrolase [Solirubrobacteraceae bacterium]|nr:alpha/beta fold hydrolase [Solirubrobacteraceae bacterium]
MSAHPSSLRHRGRRPLVAITETGEGEPLVLLHGLGTTRQIWSLVTEPLAHTRRVVTLDLPGFGESAPVGEGFELAEVTDRLARGLAAQHVTAPFDLVGHSLGGAVALTLAAQRPNLVRRLILVAPAGLQRRRPPLPGALLGQGASGLFAARRRLIALSDKPWGRRVLLAFAAADGATLSPDQARMMVEASAPAQRIAQATATIAQIDLQPLLRDTPAPLGLIWGRQDRAVPVRLADEILVQRPDAVLEVIDWTGHVPMVERPDSFALALDGVLRRLDKHATSSRASGRTTP